MIPNNTGVYNVRKSEKTRSPYPLYQTNHKDTFLELLKQKSFTKITVTEVCKNAEINRGTFYLHYYDIYDVLSDIFNDMTQDMLTTVDHLFCLNQKAVPIRSVRKYRWNHNTGHCFWMMQLPLFFWKK